MEEQYNLHMDPIWNFLFKAARLKLCSSDNNNRQREDEDERRPPLSVCDVISRT